MSDPGPATDAAMPPESTGEARFRVLFEQAAVGVALIETATGRFVRVNRKYTEIIGYSQEAMTALDFMQITHPEDLAPDLAAMEQLKRGERREFALEKRLIHKDGTPIWVALTVSPMWAPGEAPTLHIAIVQDISQRKAAEERGRQARDALESTLAALPDLLFDIDDEGRIYDFRAPVLERLAVPPEVFLHHTLAEVLPPEVAAVVQGAIDEALVRGRSTGRSYRLDLRGEEKWFEISIARKRVDTGRPRFIAIARDITERVLAERQQRSLEAQLRQSQKMEAVGTLAGGIAHDFNNLLTVIKLSVEGARSEISPDHPAAVSLHAIAHVAQRAENLVRQILTFGRTRSASRTAIVVNEALLEATSLLRATLPAGIRLVVALPEGLPLNVSADPTQLQQVLINLGTNAWQAITRGVGTITFGARRVRIEGAHLGLADGDYVALRVSDDGEGMAPETLERIFEPFFTTKGPGKGSGLGLSVVHGIVQSHGGAITATSTPGAGTTFDVYLAAAEAVPAPSVSAPKPATRSAGGAIIYVDDELALMRPVLMLLGQLGYQATGFANPRDALAAVRADPLAVDLVLTDLNMPELSGIDLARELRAIRADLPIILVSGFAPLPDEQLADHGIQHRLTKPFEAETLAAVLSTLIG